MVAKTRSAQASCGVGVGVCGGIGVVGGVVGARAEGVVERAAEGPQAETATAISKRVAEKRPRCIDQATQKSRIGLWPRNEGQARFAGGPGEREGTELGDGGGHHRTPNRC